MGHRLDKTKRYGNIFGIHEYGATFTQDGRNFNGQGHEVGEGITPPVDDPVRPGAAGPAPTEPSDGAVTAPAADTEAALKELHPAQIKKLVEEAGLVPDSGPGSKARNIAILIDAESG